MEGMVAEKNQRYLMVRMRRRICGIDPMKLITPEKDGEEAVDWKNLPPFPFDFSVDLPLGRMFALELDSKIHLVGGVKYLSEAAASYDGASEPFKKVYELDLDKKEVKESNSIYDFPGFINTRYFILHKIRSDYYLIKMCGIDRLIPSSTPPNFWVLRSGTRVWKDLPDAPGHPNVHSDSIIDHSSWFDFYGKLYLRICFEDGSVFVYSYDTHNSHWTTSEGDNSFTRSFCVPVCGQRRFFLPSVYIPDLFDPGKYLALSCECIGEKYFMCAFQVDEFGVLIFQRLEGCLDRMPYLYYEESPVLVDLDGKGTFVVMAPGFANEQTEDPVLCVLVLQVAMKFVNYPSRVFRRSVRSPLECEFLDWKVLSMHVYSMKLGINELPAFFVFPDIQGEENAQEVPRWGIKKCRRIEFRTCLLQKGGLQVGGGINSDNCLSYIEEGASHVIVTSYVFNNGQMDLERLKDLVRIVGKERLVLDLSCRKKEGKYAIVTDRWQKFSDVSLDAEVMQFLANFADEFLVHGVDVEGKKLGIDEELVALLGKHSPIPVTYAGGVTVMDDLERIKTAGMERVDVTVGSALDIFGGNMAYKDVVAWHAQQQASIV